MCKESRILFYGACSLVLVMSVALLAGCPDKASKEFSLDGIWEKDNSHPSCGEPSIQALTAGQHIDVGSVQISNDKDNIYVSYATTGGWVIAEAHAHVGLTDTDYPGYGSGNNAPVPGLFPYNTDDDPDFESGVTEYTFVIPFADLDLESDTCDIELSVFAHASVENDGESETAWGGDTPGQYSPRWYFMAPYLVQCCEDEDDCGCEGEITELVLEYFRSCEAMVHIFPMDMDQGPLFEGTVQPGQIITLEGPMLAPEIYTFVNYQIDTLIPTDCSGLVGPGLLTGDFRVISATSADGLELCPVSQEWECAPCDGGVTELSFEYLGDVECVEVDAMAHEEGAAYYWGCVDPGAEITINGPGINGAMGSRIYLWVAGEYVGSIDTSCDSPVGPGIVVGPLLVTGGKSLNGGYLCPVDLVD